MGTVKTTEIDHGYAKLVRTMRRDVKGAYVDVGLFGKKIATYAAFNEFGTESIPSRPFMRTSAKENEKKYSKMIDRGSHDIMKGGDSVKGVLTKVGYIATSDIVRKIKTNNFEANAPSTVAQKGSSKPLIDTGAMMRAITHKLGKRGRGK